MLHLLIGTDWTANRREIRAELPTMFITDKAVGS